MNKKIFGFLILGMFLLAMLPVVSATSIDYSNNDMTAHIKDTILFGLINVGEQGTMTLASHKSVTEVLEVGLGWQVNMYYDTNFGKAHQDALGEVTFIDMRTGEEVEKEWKYVYWGEEEYESPIYDYKETISLNGTIINERIQIGNETKTKGNWLDYNSKNIPKGKIRIGIMVNNKQGEYIDGVWEVQGKKIKKHASWTTDLNVNIVSYYKQDMASGSAIDSAGGNNLPGTGNINYSQTGIISDATSAVGLLTNYFSGSTSGWSGDTMSYSLWFKGVNEGDGQHFIANAQVASATSAGMRIVWGSGNINACVTDQAYSPCAIYALAYDTNFHHVVAIYDDPNIQLWLDGVNVANSTWDGRSLIESTTFRLHAWVGENTGEFILDEIGIWDRVLTGSEILNNLYNGGSGNTYTATFTPTITLNSPENTTNTTNPSINFNGTLTVFNPVNVSLIIDGVINETNSSGALGDYLFTKILSEGEHTWNYESCITTTCVNGSERHLTIDFTNPTISIEAPIETFDYLVQNKNITLNFTAIDNNLDTCLLEYNNTNTTIPCTNAIKTNTGFDYQVGFNNLTIYANDSSSNWGSNFTTWNYNIFENSRTLNATSYQTQSETFSINLTANSSLTAVVLEYNGTDFATTQSGTVYSTTFDIPAENLGNNSVRWKLTYTGDTIFSPFSYQDVQEAVWTICNATYTDNFLNISFKDEGDLSTINASIPVSRFIYYLGTGSETKLFTYVNNTDNYNYEFCATPDLTFNVDPYVQYKQGSDYPQRIYDPGLIEYTSTVTDKILYLLSSLDGIFVTFQVINSAEQGIQNVKVNGTRIISGDTVVVADGLTDAAGSITFWLNPDFQHIFTFTKSGFTTSEFIVTPTQSTYTITLGGQAPAETDCTRGVSYSTEPTNNFIDQNTNYDFDFIISSNYWALDNFSANLYYGNDTLIDSDSSTVQEGGTLSFNSINTTNQTGMYMTYAYALNGSNCISTSRNWIVQSIDGRDYSIWNLFQQSSTYLDADLYGVKGDSGDNDFGKIVITFLIIVLVTGVSIKQFGLQSEMGIITIVFGLVAMLDFGLNFIPEIEIPGGITIQNGFLTGVMFLIWLVFLIKER